MTDPNILRTACEKICLDEEEIIEKFVKTHDGILEYVLCSLNNEIRDLVEGELTEEFKGFLEKILKKN